MQEVLEALQSGALVVLEGRDGLVGLVEDFLEFLRMAIPPLPGAMRLVLLHLLKGRPEAALP